MDTRTLHCPNCSAPMAVALGETEALCHYCASRLRMIPGREELEVVRTREEMKRRERVEVQRVILQNQLRQQEGDRWRELGGRVAIAALPVVGDAAGRAIFRAAVSRGCGCACLPLLLLMAAAAAGLLALLHR